jgi:hypothetical protein
MIGTTIRLSTRDFGIVWEDLGHGRVPYPLEVPVAGATLRERAELSVRVRRDLAGRGLGYDSPGSDLAVLLGVLAGGWESVDAVGHRDGPLRAVAARDGRTGVLAVLDQNSVRLTAVWPGELAESIVDLLPPAPPGPGPVLSVPVESLAAMSGGHRDGWLSGASSDRHRSEEADLATLLSGRIAGGQFGINEVTWDGTRRRADTLVGWFDTRAGRYLLVRKGDWLSLAPADNQRIAQRIREVIGTRSG